MLDYDAFCDYQAFVENRHRVWESRQLGLPAPWSDDPILQSRKFTNVFRVLDPGSQFILTDLFADDPSPRDTLARMFLYRYTNRPSTWEYMRDLLDHYPREKDITPQLAEAVCVWRDQGNTVFSGAYTILPQPNRSGDKVVQALSLTARFMENHANDFLAAGGPATRFDALRSIYGCADFMAMQILTDWGYSAHSLDHENDFVMPGPGAVRGARGLDPVAKPMETLLWAHSAIHDSPDCPVVAGRKPSLMDIQNTLCEFSKYQRFQRRPQPNYTYTPAHPGVQKKPMLPWNWNTQN